jgi:hypothetical protein
MMKLRVAVVAIAAAVALSLTVASSVCLIACDPPVLVGP